VTRISYNCPIQSRKNYLIQNYYVLFIYYYYYYLFNLHYGTLQYILKWFILLATNNTRKKTHKINKTKQRSLKTLFYVAPPGGMDANYK